MGPDSDDEGEAGKKGKGKTRGGDGKVRGTARCLCVLKCWSRLSWRYGMELLTACIALDHAHCTRVIPPPCPDPSNTRLACQVSTLTVRRYYRPEDISQEQVGSQ